MATSMTGNQVLILGGTGFIGRNLVDYLVRNSLAKKIRVVDKVPPQMAWLNPRHTFSWQLFELSEAGWLCSKSDVIK
ncbi:hypothetical protein Btru_032799 [Bulinus truncatus]|nr:hypothetical protein Btru_032799 [Bulinus truncatus]